MSALVRLPSSVVWELRSAWATGRRVALSLDRRARFDRLEGHITAVAATGAHVHLAGRHVPVDVILAVHLPSRLGDSTARGDFHGPARRRVPQEPTELPLGALIGTVVVDRCAPMNELGIAELEATDPDEAAFGHYAIGRFAWVLKDPQVLPEPVPWRGSQGIFSVPADALGMDPTPAQGALL